VGGGEGMLKNRAIYPLFSTIQPLHSFSLPTEYILVLD